MKTIFFGTPEFAIPTLERLILSSYKPALIVSQPDKKKGRSLKLSPTPVKEVALKNNIPCYQPEDINTTQSIKYIRSLAPDIIITVAFGAMFGKELRMMCPFGAINLHPSLLPRHRGADPIRSTLLKEDSNCGVTVFFISAKMDSGNIISQTSYEIPQGINFTSLDKLLAEKGADEVIRALDSLSKRKERYKALKQAFPPQDHTKATYSNKVEKGSNLIDFDISAKEFIAKTRAYSLEPGYVCNFRNKNLKILSAEILNNVSQETITTTHTSMENGRVGVPITQIIKNKGFTIALKDSNILIKQVQYEGKKQMSAYDFHIGARLEIGEMLYNVI